MAGHGCLQAVQRLLILTQVVGHVPIRVDCQEVSTTVERTDRVHEQDVKPITEDPVFPVATAEGRDGCKCGLAGSLVWR